MKKKQPSEAGARARRFALELSRMTAEERAGIAARMPTVCNPDGHFLSPRNSMLLFMQSGRKDLTMVAGFRQWLSAGRAVRKGEKSLGLIAVPLTQIAKNSNGDPILDKDGKEAENVHFRWYPVFDVSQTEPLEEPVVAGEARA